MAREKSQQLFEDSHLQVLGILGQVGMLEIAICSLPRRHLARDARSRSTRPVVHVGPKKHHQRHDHEPQDNERSRIISSHIRNIYIIYNIKNKP